MTVASMTLTRADERQLAAVAESIVKNTVDEYNEHLTVRNGVVDERRWKKIKQRDDMRVYRERSPSLDGITAGSSHGCPQSTHSNNSSSSSETDGESVEDSKTIAPMLAFGYVEGNLDDVMYGQISPSTKDMQLKSAYTVDGFVDWTLLAPIMTPSEHDPFRELSVKRVVKGHSLLVGAVMRQRSILYLESNGIAHTPNGERIGYHVDHSIDVPGLYESPDVSVVRAKVSFCTLFRQHKANCIEVFMHGVINPMGDAFASLIAFTSADVSLAISRSTHCAEMKKLSRILSSQPAAVHALLSSSSAASMGSSISGGEGGDDDNGATPTTLAHEQVSCAQCSESILDKLKRLRPSSREKYCAMCGSHLCSRCRVHKTMFTPSATKEKKELTQTSRAFCTSCLTCVLSASSAMFASLDARAVQGEDVDYASALSMSKSDANRLRSSPEL